MNVTRKTSLIVAATCALMATIAQLFGLPGWIPVVLLVAILVAVVAALRDTQPEHDEPPVLVDPPPVLVIDPESQPTSSQVVYDVMLASAAPEYQFSFSATVYWKPIGLFSRDVDLANSAIEAVVTRAKRELAAVEPTQQELAQHRLSAILSHREADDRQGVVAWAERIQIRLPEPFADLARTRGERRRHQEITALEHAVERNVRTYLKDEAFATPGSATIWWLARHPEELERCVELYPTLRRLSNAANDIVETLDDPIAEPIAQSVVLSTPAESPPFDLWAAVENFLEGHDPDERTLKASHLAKLEDKFKRPDRARDIREQFSPNALTGRFTDGPPESHDQPTPYDSALDASDPTQPVSRPSDSTASTPAMSPSVAPAPAVPPPASPADGSEADGSANGSVASEEAPYRQAFYSTANGAATHPASDGTPLLSRGEQPAEADGLVTED